MALITICLAIVSLFIFIIVFRWHAFLSFLIVSIGVGLSQGMALDSVVTSLEKGIGNTLGFLVLILALGAMLGKQVANSGAAQQISESLFRVFGVKHTQWAVMLTGFIVGITLFYSVGFVILVPLVFTIARSTGLSLISIGLPMLAALSVTHGFLPPHPAPSAIAVLFGADIGQTLLYGMAVSVPAIIISGPVLGRFLKKVEAHPLQEFLAAKHFDKEELPSLWNSVITALLPVILIAVATVSKTFLMVDSLLNKVLLFLGNPVIALLIAVVVSVFSLGVFRGQPMKESMASFSASLSGITSVLLIIAGAGGLKQLLIDSGLSDALGTLLESSPFSPLLVGWLTAGLIRVAVGSATVAGLTAASLVLPLVQSGGVHPELMVLAIGSGSLMLSHVNDAGFWLFKEYFNLSIKDTLATWTLMETSIGVSGLLGVLALDALL
jgi:Gnt-I system high-affinity gluconate transporter